MKTKLMTTLMALITVVLFARCDNDDNINPNELPEAAQIFLKTNYPNKTFTVERDVENGQVVYEVDFTDGTDVEFSAEGKCIYVGGQTSKIPAGVIHEKILTYVSNNYPNAVIVEWEMENTYQEVELSNNIELIFDPEGNFMYSRRDDDDDDDDEVPIREDELPADARTFITTHFPGVAITGTTKETERNLTEYEVTLANTFELDFDADGDCIGIDGNKQKIPASALNRKIVSYVSTNYAATYITDWDLDTRNQEVELRNGVELTFGLDGNFLYIDNN